MRYQKTEWGLKVKMFSQRHGITLSEIAKSADVSEGTLHAVMIGRTPGRELIKKVDVFMGDHEATHRPKHYLTPFAKGAKM